MKTILDVLATRAAETPDAIAYTGIESLNVGHDLGYGALHSEAARLARSLLGLGSRGDRVLVLLPTGLEFVKAYWACLYAGMIAVPLYPPKANDQSGKIPNIVDDCGPSLAIVPDDLAQERIDELATARLQVIRFGEFESLPAASCDLPQPALDDIAFLQYSSGSTGNPKGVMISHRNIVSNLRVVESETASSRSDVFVTWLPLFHDMGMVMCILMPMYVGARSLLFSPLKFAKNPLFWFQVISKYRATFSGAPNFAYEQCVKKFSAASLEGVDLGSLRILLNGAEPIKTATLNAFIDTYVPLGLKASALMPAYGMAEATVFLCAKSYQAPLHIIDICQQRLQHGEVRREQIGDAGPMSVVSCGVPPAGHDIIIAKDFVKQAENAVGEIWASGDSISKGYWGREELSKASFGAMTTCGAGPYLRTGDLGFYADGRLFILGRIKDVLIVQGRNIYPHDVERAAGAVLPAEAAGDCVAFGIDEGGTESVVLVQEVRPRFLSLGYEAAAANMRGAAFAGAGVVLKEILFVPVGGISKTTSGKVMRAFMKERYLSGQIDSLFAHAIDVADGAFASLATDTEVRLAQLWEQLLKVEGVHAGSNFFSFGGDSLTLTRLIGTLRADWGVELALGEVFACPILEDMAALVDRVAPRAGVTGITVRDHNAGLLPLSHAQQRLWFLSRIDGHADARYVISALIRLRGGIDVAALARALAVIVERHESLRTVVVLDQEGKPSQRVNPAAPVQLASMDLSGAAPAQAEDELRAFIGREANRRFDLANDLLLRAALVTMPAGEASLLINMHHIASDGWSMGVLSAELTSLYNACVQGHEASLVTLPVQYADYALWQRSEANRARIEKDVAYWRGQLAGAPLVHSLPLDFARPSDQGFAGGWHACTIGAGLAARFKALCSAEDATLFMGLHAVFAALVSRFSNETDIAIGTPIANREQAEVAGLIGFFANMLVLRSDLSGQPTFSSLLAQSKNVSLQAHEHQFAPFDQVVGALQPVRSMSVTPLFQVVLVLQNNELPPLKLHGTEVVSTESVDLLAKFDLTLTVVESDGGLQLKWEYCADLFRAATIERLAAGFVQLLAGVVAAPAQPVLALPVVDAIEQQRLLDLLNAQRESYPQDRCLHELFEAQAARTPDNVAVVFGDASLSYAELNARANRLAHYLRASGVRADSLVGLCVERGLDMLVGLLGILKAGGAYVPLDPAYPHNRLAYIVQDSAMRMLLTEQSLATKVEQLVDGAEVVVEQMDGAAFQQRLAQYPDVNLAPCATPSSLAYIIYTSGSTGQPKGVMIEHANVGRLFDASAAKFHFDASDTWTLFHSYGFDFSVWEIWGALLHGGRLVVVPHWVARSASDFYALLCKEGVTVLNQTPSAFAALVAVDAQEQAQLSLRYVIFGGEALNIATLAPWVGRHGDAAPQLVNMYGITETTVHVTYRRLTVADIDNTLNPSVIGSALPDLSSLILTPALSLAPQGVTGELHIGGAGLARGYLNRPELTAQRFIANPFHDPADPHSSERLYKTGDLVRCLADGSLEYIGRIDDQVKIRGFRIELGEIENSLAQHAEVASAVVLAREDIPGDKRLVAYVTLQGEGGEGIAGRLAAHLQAGLPEYMVPALYVVLDSLPLTANGKVDKKALPAPDAGQLQGEYVAPATPTEQAVAAIWADVLRLDAGQVSTTSNFFQLGGHSLLVIQILSRLQEAGLATDVRTVFGAPTLGALAAALDAAAGRGAAFVAPPNLIPAGCTRITPEMLPLVALRQDEIDAVAAAVPGGHANVQDIYPLAPLQEGILFHHLMEETNDPYILPVLLAMDTRAHMDDFVAALEAIVERHDVLRTAVITRQVSSAVQVVQRQVVLPVTVLELDPALDALAQMEERMAAPQWMDLAKASLLHVTTACDPHSARCFVMLQLHHIISDHIGLEIIQAEVMAFQSGRLAQQAAPVPYREFIAQSLHQARQNDAESFFTGMLADVVEPTVPYNLLEVHGDGISIVEKKHYLATVLSRRVREAARTHKVSPAALFHAAWALVLAACSGRDDVVFGTVLSGRLQGTSGAAGTLGMFINTLPLRVKLDGNSGHALLLQVDTALRALLQVEQASLAMATACSGLPGGVPLFSAILNYRHSAPVELENRSMFESGVTLISARERTNYPLNVAIDDMGEDFIIDAQVHRNVDVERIIAYIEVAMQGLLDSLRDAPEQAALAIDVLPSHERDHLVRTVNANHVPYPHEKCIHELFEEQAARTPDLVAVQCGDEQLRYGELNARANQLAHYLRSQGVGPETLVGLCTGRGIDMMVGLLGILKAGGAYVPFDAEWPQGRMAFMAEDCSLSLMLVSSSLAARLAPLEAMVRLVVLDSAECREVLQGLPGGDVPRAPGLSSSTLANVIYTSGSTGQPKGVMVAHRNVVQLVVNEPCVPVGPSDGVVYCANPAFDASTWEIWIALLNGARLLPVPQEVLLDPHAFGDFLADTRATVLQMTAGLFAQYADVLEARFAQLNYLLFGGDKSDINTVRKVAARAKPRHLLHTYGPTETVAFTVTYEVDTVDQAMHNLPIGRPIANTQAFVLDRHLQLTPPGAVGELYIGGAGVARGYLNRPELTAERFIANPFHDAADPGSSERLYKTGDLVRYVAGDNLEYLGRIDNQVKIRGFRIELGEIESCLARQAGVGSAVVLARGDGPGDKQLVAYVTLASGVEQAGLAARLKEQLQAEMPEYMVPALYVVLDQFPLTPNGKVDYKALPMPQADLLQGDYVAPRTETERMLAAIWADVLHLDAGQISSTANFFQLGGHSLLAIRVMAQVRMTFNIDLGIREVFGADRLASMAAAIDSSVGRPARTAVARIERNGLPLPLSFAQQRLWFLDQFEGGSAHYNMATAIKVSGAFDEDIAEQAFARIIERHEPLRTTFIHTAGQPMQVIRDMPAFSLLRVDLRAVDALEQQAMLRDAVRADLAASFDLSADTMLRASFLRVGDRDGVLLLNVHHIASDGWSMGVLMEEFVQQYSGISKGSSAPLAPLAVRYADYAQWQRDWLAGEVLEQQYGYWKRQLADLPTVHSLPLDHPRPAKAGFKGARHRLMVDRATHEGLKRLANARQTTMFTVLHGALGVLLARQSNCDDVVLGTPMANRLQKDLEQLIGFFVNTLVLRTDCSGNPRFVDYLDSVKAVNHDAQAHQEVPFEYLVEKLQPVRSEQHSPLFQIMFVMGDEQWGPGRSVHLDDLAFTPMAEIDVAAKFELAFNATETVDGIAVDIDYNTDLFEATTISRLGDHLGNLLRAIVADPAMPIHDLALLGEEERAYLLQTLNADRSLHPQERCLHELFEAQAARTPDNVAVVFGDASLSYAELNARANRLAHYLRASGVQADSLVGLCVERGLDMLVGLLGILKAGGAYVPLDPAYPHNRLAYIVQDSAMRMLLTEQSLAGKVEQLVDGAEVVVEQMDGAAFQQRLAQYPDANLAPCATPSSLAYIIYTSGSTGQPKGVMIEHANVGRLFDASAAKFHFDASDTWTLFHSYGFDFSVWEIWGALLHGGRLVVVPHWVARSASDFYGLLCKEGVTVLNQTPSAFAALVAVDAQEQAQLSLRYVIFGGEALNIATLAPWVGRHGDAAPQLVNMYGITETTVHVTYRRLTVADIDNTLNPSVIGSALPDLSSLILTPALSLAPQGVTGELHIGGAGLARGYLNRPELTAQRFIANPFHDPADPHSSERLYKTGDLVRCLADGSLEYIGRIDDQVKIRGFRIELGEIENSLAQHAEVASAVVLAREDIPGDKRLVAYVTLQGEGGEGIAGRLAAHLQAGLPEYMVPALYVVLDSLPLTANGKVDKKALPAPDAGQLQGEYVAPATPTEQAVAAIWADVLRLDAGQVSTTSNFFQLGGHSLLVIQILSRLQEAGLATDVRTVFGAPTLGALAAALDAAAGRGAAFVAPPNLIPAGCTRITPEMLPLVALRQDEIDAVAAAVPGGHANVQDIYPLAPLQEGILFHHMMHEGSDPYITPVLLAVESASHLGRLVEALQAIVDRHDVLRTAIVSSLQVVQRRVTLPLTVLGRDPARDAREQMTSRLAAPQWMDLAQAPLLHVETLSDPQSECSFVLLKLHHIVSDHIGLEIIQEELTAHLNGQVAQLADPMAYREFVAHALHQGKHNDAEAYFRSMLGTVAESTAPFDLVNVHGDGTEIVEKRRQLDDTLAIQLREAARAHNVSPASLFHAAWALVIAACSGREDVVFGTVLSGRLQGTKGAARMLGMFINTLPIRVALEGKSVAQLLEETEISLRSLLSYEQASLALAQRCSAVASGVPLFSAMLNYRHSNPDALADASPVVAAGVTLVNARERTNYPFTMSVDDLGEGFSLDAQIHRSVDADSIVGYMESAVRALVEALRVEPGRAVAQVSLLSSEEQHRLLKTLNATATDFPREQCIHELIEAQVARTPELAAVVFEDTVLTYAELNARANRLAHCLRARGVQADSLVGLYVERSLDMMVAVLAILKAGGAYVPLDPSYPQQRLAYMIGNSDMALLLTSSALADKAAELTSIACLALDGPGLQTELARHAEDNPARLEGQSAASLAYVIYTSGSTGLPKGVMTEHRALVNRIDWMQREYRLTPADVVLQKTPFSFDVSVWELTWPFTVGASLVLAKPEGHKDPGYLCSLIQARGVTTLHFVPSMLQAMLAASQWRDCVSVRQVFCSGEALGAEIVNRHYQVHDALIHNLYGPTEAAIDVSYWTCGRDTAHSIIPIGKPIQNIVLHVLGARNQLQPFGVAGELHIGGVGLARAYLNRPDLTAERFIANPFHDPADPHSSARLYKTGDLVRYLADGNIEYLGRMDDQVKIRGFRIELGEIENCLAQHGEIGGAVVLAREDVPGDKRLVAYVTLANAPRDGLVDRLKAHLHAALPDYMVPALYVVLPSIPVTANGKADRKALPAPDAGLLQGEYVAPATTTERALAEIWAQVLGIEAGQVGANANFFHLGGHSLLAIRVVTQVRKQLDLDLRIKDVYSAATLSALAAILDASAGLVQRPLITACERSSNVAPMSFAQQRLWFLDQLDGASAQYNMSAILEVTGRFDESLAEQAFQRIVDRHEPLRTVFASHAGQPVQVIRETAEFRLQRVDLRGIEPALQQAMVRQSVCAERAASFDLAADLMIRASFTRLADGEGVLLFSMHHIASDGWSMGLLVDEFIAQYEALSKGWDNPHAPLAVRYADYAHWQREWLAAEVFEQQAEYWLGQLADLPVVHSLSLDMPRPAQQTFNGARHVLLLAPSTHQGLVALAKDRHATLFMVLHAALSVLLARHAGNGDVVIGTPVANRTQLELEDLIGFFVNTLVLRTDCSANPRFIDFLDEVKAVNRDALANQDVPFEHLVERIRPVRSAQHSPLFQVMFGMDMSGAGLSSLQALDDVRFVPVAGDDVVAKFDLDFNVSEGVDGLQVRVDYNSDLFVAATIEGMAERFGILLAAIVADPAAPIHDLPLFGEAERVRLVRTVNANHVPYPHEKCIHELFEEQTARTPDLVAVQCGDEQLRYGELNARANQLAHYLRSQGVGPETLVGLCTGRGIDMMVGLLGILKAGGAYVPFDAEWPQGRMAFMAEDCSLSLMLVSSSLAARLAPLEAMVRLVVLDSAECREVLQGLPGGDVPRAPSLSSSTLANVIYTSGSTGQPKGVMVAHRNVVQLVVNEPCVPVGPSDGVVYCANPAFDASTWEIWIALLNGARLLPVPQEVLLDPHAFGDFLADTRATVLQMTAGLFAQYADVLEARFAQLDYLLFGGDKSDINTVRKVTARAKPRHLLHTYGPTETVAFTVTYEVDTVDQAMHNLPIGRPIANTQAFVLDRHLQLTPPGAVGELYIGGAGVARGYLNRPELTAERFIANPFHDAADPGSSERLYKTGDLVRYVAGDNLEYLGRIDNQVKIRGFRIELGEIESCLARQAGVGSAVVLARGDGPGDKQLVAYVTLVSGVEQAGLAARLKEQLQAEMPEYMVPALYVVLDQFPLTPNGKVDYKALPMPQADLLQGDYVAPRTETERMLAAIWADVLHLDADQISSTANFFQLGGHSLLVIAILARLQGLGKHTDVRTLFGAATLADLAARLDASVDAVAAPFVAPANLIPPQCLNITPEMLPLVSLTQDEIDLVVGGVPGGVENIQDIYPLAPLQEGILFHHLMQDGSDPYIMPVLLSVDSQAQLDAFLAALQATVDRHDVLRTAVVSRDLRRAVQVVLRQLVLPVAEITLDPRRDAQEQLLERMSAPQWLDLSQAPLIRTSVARDPLSERRFILLQLHHIVSDHIGMEVIQGEVLAHIMGKGGQLAKPVPYREFVAHTLHAAQHQDAEAYFTRTLGDVSEPTAPYNLVDVHGDGSAAATLKRQVPAALAQSIRNAARDQKVSSATLFHAAWALVIAACSGRNDVVFGTVLSGRLQGTSGAAHMLGMFINTLPLRVDLNGKDAAQLLAQTEAALRELLGYEQASLALAQRCSALPGGTPLFSAMLNYRHSALVNPLEQGRAQTGITVISEQERTNYPLNVSIDDLGEGFAIDVQVDRSISAARIADYIETAMSSLLGALQGGSRQVVTAMTILPPAEVDHLVRGLNSARVAVPRDACIHELIEAKVAETPDAVALVFEDQRLSYGELNVRANRLAAYLREQGVQADSLVGLCVTRGFDMIVGLLAILKAGGGYVPLDPDNPPNRLAYMVENSGLTLLLTQVSLADKVAQAAASPDKLSIVSLDDDGFQARLAGYPATNPGRSPGQCAANLAYVIYTSGSTGQPKGVMVEHGTFVNLMAWYEQLCIRDGQDDAVLLLSNFSFDLTQKNIFATLQAGAVLVIPESGLFDPVAIRAVIQRNRVTVVNVTPAVFYALVDGAGRDELASLKAAVLGGEPISYSRLQQWHQGSTCSLVNSYGPTECSDVSSYFVLETADDDANRLVPLGIPVPNVGLYVLGDDLQLLPHGVTGELYIGGAGVARGYLKRPDLTAERFLVNPFHDPADASSSERLYRSGDLARYLPDGKLEYMGRIDDQVKIRGFRIELGEIETRLMKHDEVASAVVMARSDGQGEKRLCAYLTLAAEEGADLVARLKAHLLASLPDYMVPALFVVLEAFPLSANGKVDKKALPAPDARQLGAGYVAPTTDTEHGLVAIWSTLLQLPGEEIGVASNFFALGGHSLLIVQLGAAIRAQFQVEFQLKELFAENRLDELALKIDLRRQQLSDDTRRASLIDRSGKTKSDRKRVVA